MIYRHIKTQEVFLHRGTGSYNGAFVHILENQKTGKVVIVDDCQVYENENNRYKLYELIDKEVK
jgi:hypothetical protein